VKNVLKPIGDIIDISPNGSQLPQVNSGAPKKKEVKILRHIVVIIEGWKITIKWESISETTLNQ